jgi:hypothetical protein
MALAVYESGVVREGREGREVVEALKEEEPKDKKLGEAEGEAVGLVGRRGCTNFRMRLRVA